MVRVMVVMVRIRVRVKVRVSSGLPVAGFRLWAGPNFMHNHAVVKAMLEVLYRPTQQQRNAVSLCTFENCCVWHRAYYACSSRIR